MKKIFIYFLVLLTSACHSRLDFNGYYLQVENESYNTINIDKGTVYTDGDKRDTSKKMVLFKYYNSQDSLIESVGVPHDFQIVTGYIDSIFNDDKYLLVSQKPYGLICECMYDCQKLNFPDVKRTFDLCVGAVKKFKFHQYWIIVKDSNALYGPLTRKEFIDHFIFFKISRQNVLQQVFNE